MADGSWPAVAVFKLGRTPMLNDSAICVAAGASKNSSTRLGYSFSSLPNCARQCSAAGFTKAGAVLTLAGSSCKCWHPSWPYRACSLVLGL